MTPQPEPRSSVIERAALIMSAFTTVHGHLLLDDLTRHSGLPRSTAFRLAMQLVDVGWLERDADGLGFRLGPAMQALGRPGRHETLTATARPELMALHDATHFSAHLSVIEADGMVHYVDVVRGDAPGEPPSHRGRRFPLERTAAGKSMIAGMSSSAAERHLRERERQGVLLDGVRRELPRIKHNRGVASRVGTIANKHVYALSAPIWGPSGAVGALSLASHKSLHPSLVPAILRSTYRIAEALHPGMGADLGTRGTKEG